MAYAVCGTRQHGARSNVFWRHVRHGHLSRHSACHYTAQTPRRLHFRRCPPLFPIQTWNVFDASATLNNQACTNNLCESWWKNGFSQLVGHDHPSVWLLIDTMRKDAVMDMTDIECDGRGQPPRRRVRKATRALQLSLQRICMARCDNQKTVAETPSAAGHTIRFAWQTRELCVTERTVACRHIAYTIEMFCKYMIFNISVFQL